MDFKEVVGSRRSIRHFQPWRPVEKEKIQVMLEAARPASRAVDAPFYRTVVKKVTMTTNKRHYWEFLVLMMPAEMLAQDVLSASV